MIACSSNFEILFKKPFPILQFPLKRQIYFRLLTAERLNFECNFVYKKSEKQQENLTWTNSLTCRMLKDLRLFSTRDRFSFATFSRFSPRSLSRFLLRFLPILLMYLYTTKKFSHGITTECRILRNWVEKVAGEKIRGWKTSSNLHMPLNGKSIEFCGDFGRNYLQASTLKWTPLASSPHITQMSGSSVRSIWVWGFLKIHKIMEFCWQCWLLRRKQNRKTSAQNANKTSITVLEWKLRARFVGIFTRRWSNQTKILKSSENGTENK